MPLPSHKRQMVEVAWNRCDICGRFIAIDDFPDKATRLLVTPDSDLSKEEYETYHNSCQRSFLEAQPWPRGLFK